jgi:hypothetical protein
MNFREERQFGVAASTLPFRLLIRWDDAPGDSAVVFPKWHGQRLGLKRTAPVSRMIMTTRG